MKTIDLRGKDILALSEREIGDLLPRASFDTSSARGQVQGLVDDVKLNGDRALIEQTKRFDGIELESIIVPQAKFEEAWDALDNELKEALTQAKNRITKVHSEQVPSEHISILDDANNAVNSGAKITQRYIPVKRVGLYVPGGQAVYPSSVLMNAIPALCAGVKEIYIASPPQKSNNGLPHPTILAACHLLGITACISVGGAGAIAAFAYGTESVKAVDVITGPGNIYVASAKQIVQGIVGVDAIAGPTEIMIIADETANPAFVAADLIGQAEHDELAGSVLVTNSDVLANKVSELLPAMIDKQMSKNRIKTALDGAQSAIMLVNSLEECILIANSYGAEHLEIQTTNPNDIASKINNAGAIFIGDYSPVSLGDYIGGSNHVLPTGGTSRFSSGLGVHAFLRSVQQIEYSKPKLSELQHYINVLANDELLPAHAEAVNERFR